MNPLDRSLLICTNGAPTGLGAIDYGCWLAGRLALPVTLLGIVEKPEHSAAVTKALEQARADLEQAGIPCEVQKASGPAREIIIQTAQEGRHLVVMGSLGRPGWKRWLRGHAVRRLLPHLKPPLLYVPQAHLRLERILLCTGALSHARSAECWALALARKTGARLSILHVTESVYYHYPTAEKLRTHWRDLLETDIPQAQHLRELKAEAEALGLSVELRLRQGTVIQTILHEAQQGFDLLVMGSRYSVHSLRVHYQPDVTADVMEALTIPTLAVQAGQECIL